MTARALYPGTFDPITNGHIDLAERASRMFEHVVVAIATSTAKDPLFSVEERLQLTQKVLSHIDNVSVSSFSGLLVNCVNEHNTSVVLRGLRAVSDFEYEFQLAGMNRKLNKNIETLFLMSDVENQIISSRFVKEIVNLKGDIKKFTTKSTIKLLKRKYE